jgi:uncharacterized protein (DUF1684 family)
MRVLAAFAAVPLLFVTASSAGAASFADEEQRWRAAYDYSLTGPEGWLSVAGLFWLHEGWNSAGSDPHSDIRLPSGSPVHAGAFRLEHGAVTWVPTQGATMKVEPDTSERPGVITIGDLSLTAIRRAGKTGIRLRDPNAPPRRAFKGTSWFPPDPSWRVKAKWIALPTPKKVSITNILGMTEDEDCPGYAEWVRDGKTYRLEPVLEDNLLFFMFKDATNSHTTYAAGRFLYADSPKNGELILDFNQAHNPPCAFTAYATCPLPPPQNRLALAVNAGEKMYGHHAQ